MEGFVAAAGSARKMGYQRDVQPHEHFYSIPYIDIQRGQAVLLDGLYCSLPRVSEPHFIDEPHFIEYAVIRFFRHGGPWCLDFK